MLINLTNHPYQSWGQKQKDDINTKYGKVVDMTFPFLDPNEPNEEEKIAQLVREYRDKLITLKPDAVLLMGEWSFTMSLVNELLKNNIKVLSTAINLDMKITKNPDGSTSRIANIHYVGLREYHYLKVI